jgi:hypothetical protein
LGLASASLIRLDKTGSKSGETKSARRLDTYPYEAGIKFLLQPQNNARFNSRFFADLFSSQSGLEGAAALQTRRAIEFSEDATHPSTPYA